MPKAHPVRANPSLRERFDALRNLPPFLRQIWATSRGLTIASLGLRLLRALLPVVMLYIGKLIIDEVVRLVGVGVGFDALLPAWRDGVLDPLAMFVAIEFGLAIVSDLLGRMVSYADSTLSELFTNATSVRLMEHAATLDLEDFRSEEVVRRVGVGVGFDALLPAWRDGVLDPLAMFVAIEFGLAIVSDLLGRMVSYADSTLSELFTNATSVRLMEHAATLDLEDF